MADDGYSRQRIPFSRNNFSGRVIESVELQQNVSSSGPGTPDVYSWGTPSRYVQGPPAPESRPQVTGYSTYEVTSPMQSKCHARLKRCAVQSSRTRKFSSWASNFSFSLSQCVRAVQVFFLLNQKLTSMFNPGKKNVTISCLRLKGKVEFKFFKAFCKHKWLQFSYLRN